MTDFDPIKAMREQAAGIRDVHATILTLARGAERKLAEAEAEHTALMKTEAFARQLLTDATDKLRALQDAAEKAKGAPT